MTQQRVTLKEVAARAGVSYQTVSKVLNNTAQVSKSTEERIHAAVRELGYRPNQIARSLRSLRSKKIGYSWQPTPQGEVNTILDQFLQSMAAAVLNAGYHILTFPYQAGDAWVAGYRELIDTNQVDGFVVSSVEYDDPRLVLLQERGFPFVAFGRSNPDWSFAWVDIDGGDGLEQVIEHLYDLGHTQIAVLAWPADSRVGNNRLEGMFTALERHGLDLPEAWLLRGEGSFEFGYQAVRDLLQNNTPRPGAIVAFNDLMAIGAMRAVQELGLVVGRDVAITGFDDVPLSQYLHPSLTTVRQPIWQVGSLVIETLFKVLDGAPPQTHLIRPELVIRESTLWNPQARSRG